MKLDTAARRDTDSDDEEVDMQEAAEDIAQLTRTIEFKDSVIQQLQMALDDADRRNTASDVQEDEMRDADSVDARLESDLQQAHKRIEQLSATVEQLQADRSNTATDAQEAKTPNAYVTHLVEKGSEQAVLAQALLIELQNLIAVSENLTESQTSRNQHLEDISKKLADALYQAKGRAQHWVNKGKRADGSKPNEAPYINVNLQRAESGVSLLSNISSGVLRQIQYDNGEFTKTENACRNTRKKFSTLLTRLGPAPQHAESRDFSGADERFIKRENERPIRATAGSVPRGGAAVRGASAGYAPGRGRAAQNVTRQREPASEVRQRNVPAAYKHLLTDEQGFTVSNWNKWASANPEPRPKFWSEIASSRNIFTALPDHGQRLPESPAQPSPSSMSTSRDPEKHEGSDGARRPPKAQILQDAAHSGKPLVHAPPVEAPVTAQGQRAAAKSKISTGTEGLRPPKSSFNPGVASFTPEASKSMAQVAAAPRPLIDPDYSPYEMFDPPPAPTVISNVSKNVRMGNSVMGNVVEPYVPLNFAAEMEKTFGPMPDKWADTIDEDGMEYETGQDPNSSSRKDSPEEGDSPSRSFRIDAKDPSPTEKVQQPEVPDNTGSNTAAATDENSDGQEASEEEDDGAPEQVAQTASSQPERLSPPQPPGTYQRGKKDFEEEEKYKPPVKTGKKKKRASRRG